MDLGRHGARAVVSGASRGIGLAIAHVLAAEGCAVGLLARGAADLDAAVASVAEHGPRTVGRVVDVTDAVALTAAVDQVAAELGGLDRVVANVGGSVGRNLLDAPATEVAAGFAATFDLNVGQAVTMVRAAESQLARVVGAELAGRRIRVNAVSPGSIDAPGNGWAELRERDPDVLAFGPASWVTGTDIAVDGGQQRATRLRFS